MKAVLVIGTLDTKGREVEYLRSCLEGLGVKALVLDAGMKGPPLIEPDIDRSVVAREAGSSFEEVASIEHEGRASEIMMKGVSKVVRRLYEEGLIAGVIGVGGSMGTAIATAAMKELPVGFPKVMVSTIAVKGSQQFIEYRDVFMVSPVTDLLGLNSVNRAVLANAAVAVASMAKAWRGEVVAERPRVGITLLGILSDVVKRVKERLEAEGFEVLPFHAVGAGGLALEDLVDKGLIDAGVVDLVTKELLDHLFGGWLDAGPRRLEAAGRRGLPQVVSLGCLDFINFSPPSSVPPQFQGRPSYLHNPLVVEVRSSIEELKAVADVMAEKLSRARGPVVVVAPLRGFSPRDREGGVFYDPEADRAFIKYLKERLPRHVKFLEVDAHINDPAFAEALAEAFLELKNRVK